MEVVVLVVVAEYYERRKKFFDKYPDFFSDFIEPELEYGIYGALTMPKEQIEEIKYASEKLWGVLRKVKEHVITLSHDEIVNLGYPRQLIPFLKLDYLSFDTVLSRFDFIVTDDEIKAIELNNVTPFLVTETFLMNNEIVKFENSENEGLSKPKLISANENCENEITSSYTRGIIDCCNFLEINNPKIGIISQDIWEDWEEYAQVDYIRSMIPTYLGDIEFFNIDDLTIEYGVGAYAPSGDKIDILIMPAYPYEFLIYDENEKGETVGIELLKLVEEKKLAILNPPSANILQSKITFSLLWNMYMNGKLTPEDSEIVSKYVAPTYNAPFPFYIDNSAYVKKPVLSREGSSVEIVKEHGTIRSKYDYYSEYESVYQKFIELPKQEVIINHEYQEKRFIIGSFICNDNAVGLSCRLGGEITEWDSHWLAVAHIEDEE
ncbi:glutathionylspermidine synthase family protein [Lysinibacillus xylanilyticus]|uniref:glutathionylspermidine synthase family protein n=1 Tax=Lysinibacillus xylanilyticus TaxID=582475 RepID=UPI00381EFE5D